MNTPIINTNATIAYFPSAAAVVRTSTPGAKPTTVEEKVNETGGVSPWGDDNLFPQNVVKLAEKTFVPTVIEFKVRALVSRLIYGKVDPDTGKFNRTSNPEIDAWLRRTSIKRYLVEAALDYYWFGNFFPEIILNNDRSEITSISVQEASYCRWSIHNPKTGLSDWCYISANWANGATATTADTAKVRAIDPYYDPEGSLRSGRDFKYIYPVSFPSPGKSYYQLASWDSIRKNGWLELASLIPTWKKHLMKNQISIKYHIDIPEYYWRWKYKNWDQMNQAEQTNARTSEMTAFNDFLTGETSAGRSIMTTFKFDENRNVKYPGWTITPLDDKIADGKYIEDSQEASSHILFALGVDGTLIGNTPGKGMGAGSGSDKRVAMNNQQLLSKLDEGYILDPLQFIAQYNGWDPGIEFRFEREMIATLDSGSQTQKIY